MSAESKRFLLRHHGASFVLMFAERSADEKRRLLEMPAAEVFFEKQFVEYMRWCAGQFRAAGQLRTAALFLSLAGLFESCREDAYASVLARITERMSSLSGLLQGAAVLTPTESFSVVIANGKAELIELPNLNVHTVAKHLASRLTPEWMWKVVGPIHDYLINPNGGKLERHSSVVFVPPGLIALLPLCAARSERNAECFGDHWTVSVAPSVQALQRSRDRWAGRHESPAKLLAIIDPRRDLPWAQLEKATLLERFAHAEPVILEFEDATVRSVLLHLSSATHIHVAAHALTDPRFPERSYIQLADGKLTVEMLRQYRMNRAQLVFLSACESAVAGVVAPDEHIGWPAALLEAGVACVIGALWPVPDFGSAVFARRFYQFHLADGGAELAAPAEALRAAQAWLREVPLKQLRPWLPEQFRSLPAWLQNAGDDEQPFAALQIWSVWTATGWTGTSAHGKD